MDYWCVCFLSSVLFSCPAVVQAVFSFHWTYWNRIYKFRKQKSYTQLPTQKFQSSDTWIHEEAQVNNRNGISMKEKVLFIHLQLWLCYIITSIIELQYRYYTLSAMTGQHLWNKEHYNEIYAKLNFLYEDLWSNIQQYLSITVEFEARKRKEMLVYLIYFYCHRYHSG